MPTNSKTTSAAQPTPNSGDQPIDPQPAAASVQPAAPMDESTADNGTQAEASLTVSEGDEGNGESQLSEVEVREEEEANTEVQQKASILMAARLGKAYARVRSDLLDRIEWEKEFGCLWLEAKKSTIPASGLKIEQWTKQFLPCSQQYANACARLAKRYAGFVAAHDWYQQTGYADGWRARHNTGYGYALEVIEIRKKAELGNSPEPKPKDAANGPSAKKRTQALERERDDERREKLRLAEELERVIKLYRATPAGEHFDSPVLAAMRLAQSRKMVSSETKVAEDRLEQDSGEKAGAVAISNRERAARTKQKHSAASHAGDGKQTDKPKPTKAHLAKFKPSANRQIGGEDTSAYS